MVGSFFASDNTCEICKAGYQTSCVHRVPMGTLGAQAEYLRVPLADGTLVATPDVPSAAPSRPCCSPDLPPRGVTVELKPVNPTAKAPASNFTGDVYVTPIYKGEEPSRMTVALVRFTPGAHTNWHTHAVGQTLHVTEGVGLVGTRDGSVLRIHGGETVICPPGEDHWHGAAVDTFMSHLAMLEALPDGGDPTTWLEPVTDEQYKVANDQ